MGFAIRTRGAGPAGAFAAAGWLLAEVALILMVVFQGSLPPKSEKPAAAHTSHTQPRKPDAKPPGTKLTPERPPGISLTKVRIRGNIILDGQNDPAIARNFIRRIQASKTHRPGMILLFGVSYSTSEPSSGEEVSRDMRDLIVDTKFYDRWQPVIRPFLQVYGAGYHTGEVFADVYYYRRTR